jgi:hypothetical protein
MCEVNGSKVIKGGGYKKSNIHVVGDKSYMGAERTRMSPRGGEYAI